LAIIWVFEFISIADTQPVIDREGYKAFGSKELIPRHETIEKDKC
jgi:hypothetical protein